MDNGQLDDRKAKEAGERKKMVNRSRREGRGSEGRIEVAQRGKEALGSLFHLLGSSQLCSATSCLLPLRGRAGGRHDSSPFSTSFLSLHINQF